MQPEATESGAVKLTCQTYRKLIQLPGPFGP